MIYNGKQYIHVHTINNMHWMASHYLISILQLEHEQFIFSKSIINGWFQVGCVSGLISSYPYLHYTLNFVGFFRAVVGQSAGRMKSSCLEVLFLVQRRWRVPKEIQYMTCNKQDG